MRQGMLERCAPSYRVQQALHALINDYLETLPADDLLVQNERMWHLIGEHDPLRAARYYSTIDMASESINNRTGASWTLVDWIASGESEDGDNPNLAWILSWLNTDELTNEESSHLAYNCMFGLQKLMKNEVKLAIQSQLVEAVNIAMQRITGSNPENALFRHALGASYDEIGDLRSHQGDLSGALSAYQMHITIIERLITDTGMFFLQHFLAVSYEKYGKIQQEMGDLSSAKRVFLTTLSIRERLTIQEPGNLDWKSALSGSHISLGDVWETEGDLSKALQEYQAAMDIRSHLVSLDPANPDWQYDLAHIHEIIANMFVAKGDLTGATHAFQLCQSILDRLVSSDPKNIGWQRNLATINQELGNVLKAQGDIADALRAYQSSLAIIDHLAAADPGDADRLIDLSTSAMTVWVTFSWCKVTCPVPCMTTRPAWLSANNSLSATMITWGCSA